MASTEFTKLLEDGRPDARRTAKRIKLERTINPDFRTSGDDQRRIARMIEMFELGIIGIEKYAFDKSQEHPDEKERFRAMCSDCVDLLEIIQIPDEPIQKMEHVLKIIAYSYLGERWEGVKRILADGDPYMPNSDPKEWDMRTFRTIYDAVIRLAKKDGWDDLKKVSDLISTLRDEQKTYEKSYLDGREERFQRGAAYELASLYHLAKCVELVGTYAMQGTPPNIGVLMEMHFDKASVYAKRGGHIGLELLLKLLNLTFQKMIENSIWAVANRVNSKVKDFAEQITKSARPIFELMYPQRITVLKKGLLDPAHRAVVVDLPTSSGKTLIAEFRILQALNHFAGTKSWIAYVAPTRALVNQITNRLRRDLEPMGIRVEKMSSTLDPDAFERAVIGAEDEAKVIVVTPEKLSLLIRGSVDGLNDSLILTVVDEAHNISDMGRGLNLEMLLSIIKNDCKNANLLLLTPFIPNRDQIAQWLDPENPKSISIGLNWRPNDSVVGMYYPTGSGRDVTIRFKPMLYPPDNTDVPKDMDLGKDSKRTYTLGEAKNTKYILTSLAARSMAERGNVLVLADTVQNTWKTADELARLMPKNQDVNEDIILVKKFVAAELGPRFPLVRYLDMEIGVHNSGLPDEVKQLMEWLMENGSLKVLVSTTTIAQGMNFPASSILISSHQHGKEKMQYRDFWNLAGRVGRIDQKSMGIVGLAVSDKEGDDAVKVSRFVKSGVEEVNSVLAQLFNKAEELGQDMNLQALANEPEWSNFLQYVAHMYNQSNDLQDFISRTEINLRNTYGYHQLEPPQRSILLKAVNSYGAELDKNGELARLSDQTGFSPETVRTTIDKIASLNIPQSEWESSRMFSPSTDTLARLVEVMTDNIPEIKGISDISMSDGTTPSAISGMMTDWVSGKDIPYIARRYFGGTDTDSVRKCVQAIYGKISRFASWGLASIGKMPSSGIDFEGLSYEQKSRLYNMPAMVYYGVNSDEAILMRINNVPRGIAQGLGEIYLQTHRDSSTYDARSSEVIDWLDKLDSSEWDSLGTGEISGSEYKKIWQNITRG